MKQYKKKRVAKYRAPEMITGLMYGASVFTVHWWAMGYVYNDIKVHMNNVRGLRMVPRSAAR